MWSPYKRVFLAFATGHESVECQERRPDVAGEWAITINFIYGVGEHTAIIEQNADTLSGTYKGEIIEGTLRGSVKGENIDFTGSIRHEASGLRYHYTGVVRNDQMEGTVDMGEYWSGTWIARRVKRD